MQLMPDRATHVAPEIKRAPLTLAKVSPTGLFEGYASLFNVADLGRDVVMPGAFAESLARRGAGGVKLLWQHDPREPVGAWLSLVEDARGLKVRGRLNLAVARAREILALMKESAVDGLSIGFRTQRSARDPGTGLRKLYKLDLWEISLVTFPMLPQARVIAAAHAKGATMKTRAHWNLAADAVSSALARVETPLI